MVDESRSTHIPDGVQSQKQELCQGVPIGQFGVSESDITNSKNSDDLLNALRGLDQRIRVLQRAGGSGATGPLVNIARTEVEKFKHNVEKLLGRTITLPEGVE